MISALRDILSSTTESAFYPNMHIDCYDTVIRRTGGCNIDLVCNSVITALYNNINGLLFNCDE